MSTCCPSFRAAWPHRQWPPARPDPPCLIDESAGYRKLLDDSISLLKSRGVSAEGYLASGNIIEQIIAFSRRLAVDLIVLGHYPAAFGRFLVGQSESHVLAERANCCVLVAVNAADTPASGGA